MRNFLQTLASYVWDVPVETCDSPVSGRLEVKLSGGKYILDSPRANYSFGSLHRLFQQVFKRIGLVSDPPASVLLLGLGGGSVISILRKEYRLHMPITAVEADPEVIRIAARYFQTGQYNFLNIVQGDAAEFVARDETRYGMIIVDIFVDNNIPEAFMQPSFIANCKRILQNDGILVFNFIVQNPVQKQHYEDLLQSVDSLGLRRDELRIFSTNRVLVIKN